MCATVVALLVDPHDVLHRAPETPRSTVAGLVADLEDAAAGLVDEYGGAPDAALLREFLRFANPRSLSPTDMLRLDKADNEISYHRPPRQVAAYVQRDDALLALAAVRAFAEYVDADRSASWLWTLYRQFAADLDPMPVESREVAAMAGAIGAAFTPRFARRHTPLPDITDQAGSNATPQQKGGRMPANTKTNKAVAEKDLLVAMANQIAADISAGRIDEALAGIAEAKAAYPDKRLPEPFGNWDRLEDVAKRHAPPRPATVQLAAEPVKAEPVKAEPVKAEPVKAEPVKAEPVKGEIVVAHVTGNDVKRVDVPGLTTPAAEPAAEPDPADVDPAAGITWTISHSVALGTVMVSSGEVTDRALKFRISGLMRGLKQGWDWHRTGKYWYVRGSMTNGCDTIKLHRAEAAMAEADLTVLIGEIDNRADDGSIVPPKVSDAESKRRRLAYDARRASILWGLTTPDGLPCADQCGATLAGEAHLVEGRDGLPRALSAVCADGKGEFVKPSEPVAAEILPEMGPEGDDEPEPTAAPKRASRTKATPAPAAPAADPKALMDLVSAAFAAAAAGDTAAIAGVLAQLAPAPVAAPVAAEPPKRSRRVATPKPGQGKATAPTVPAAPAQWPLAVTEDGNGGLVATYDLPAGAHVKKTRQMLNRDLFHKVTMPLRVRGEEPLRIQVTAADGKVTIAVDVPIRGNGKINRGDLAVKLDAEARATLATVAGVIAGKR